MMKSFIISKKFVPLIIVLLFSMSAFSAKWKYTTDIDIDVPFQNVLLPIPIFTKISL